MSTGHSCVFYDVPFMSSAQFFTGVLIFSNFWILTFCHAYSDYFSQIKNLLNASLPSTFLTQRPSSFFPNEPANWLTPRTLPLCPSSWGCLSSFKDMNQDMLPLCPKISPHSPSSLEVISLLLFTMESLPVALRCQLLTSSVSVHPLPVQECLFPLPLSIHSNSGFNIQIFPLKCFPRSSQRK